MNKGLWIARKNYLYSLMKKVSILRGGDTEDNIKLHFDYLLCEYDDEKIEIAINCYKAVLNELERSKVYED